jgi:hypothetical protein
MVREEDKPFICYQQGWNIKITPRNAAGWRALGLWMVVLLLPAAAMMALAVRLDDTPQEYIVLWTTVPLLIIMGIISFVMTRWMKARSQIIDVDGIVKFQQEQGRQTKKRGRL